MNGVRADAEAYCIDRGVAHACGEIWADLAGDLRQGGLACCILHTDWRFNRKTDRTFALWAGPVQLRKYMYLYCRRLLVQMAVTAYSICIITVELRYRHVMLTVQCSSVGLYCNT